MAAGIWGQFLIIGIDAANLRRGGGVTHLVELLRALQPEKLRIQNVVVWGGALTLAALGHRPWLVKCNPAALDKGLLQRALWQRYRLSVAARAEGCAVLLVPGGSYAGDFQPVVTLSQNLLPFEWPELRRYGWSGMTLKMRLLRYTQSRGFQRSTGVIFLTEYARQAVVKVTGSLAGQTSIIPHGVNARFRQPPNDRRSRRVYTLEQPCRLLYVSIIDQYKHQWQVVEAVSMLRAEGWPLVLDLVGPAYPPALKRLRAAVARCDPEGDWVRYRGAVPHGDLHRFYQDADIGVFASSCENLPIILIETMAAGLPVACSDRGPMPEILRDAGVYFDPERPADIARALRELIATPALRAEKAQASYAAALAYDWKRCADDTFGFLARIAEQSSEVRMGYGGRSLPPV